MFRQLVCVLFLLSWTAAGGAAAGATAQQRSPAFRIFTAGIRHESNTFSPWRTTRAEFTVRHGEEAQAGQSWAALLRDRGAMVTTSLHAYARPYGIVERATYEAFRDEILAAARKAGEVDGVYLDMHGAMHAEGYEDAQVDLLRGLRAIVGRKPLFAASFDLHGNISSELIGELDLMTAYRTAPHIDAEETRARAVRLLMEALQRGERPAIAHLRVPILIPGEKGITSAEPLRSLYRQLPEIGGRAGLVDASIFAGMPWTDVARAGMSVQVVAQSASQLPAAREEARRLATAIWSRRAQLDFDVEALELGPALELALRAPEKPVFLTDSGDNTTAGAAGDSTVVLRRMLARELPDAVFAGIVDSSAVQACERAGVGKRVKLKVGGKLDRLSSSPLAIDGTVVRLTPPELRDTDRRAAVVAIGGLQLVLLATRRSFTSPEDFADVGIDTMAHKIVVVKLGYLFAPLRAVAAREILMLTPGFADQRLEKLTYKNVQRPIYPLNPEMTWAPPAP
jgi:microcystin degradation protein MlrC